MSKKSKSKTSAQNTPKQDPDTMMKAVVLLSLGAFLFFFYVSLSGFSSLLEGPSSQPVTTQVLGANTAKEVANEVSVFVNNANLGEAVLELHFDQPTAISGAEFHFALEESLAIDGVVCSSQFVCVEEMEEGVYHLSMFRLPDQADVPLTGKVKVATLLYDDNSYGEMVVNGQLTRPSMIAELGSDMNLLAPDTLYLAVGRRAY